VVGVELDGSLSLTYDDDRVIYVDDEELLLKSAAIIQNNPGIPVLIKADRGVVYEKVVRAMVVLQQAGAPGVGLITRPPEPAGGAGS
jgi:biopolymer transport protein TolR